MSSNRRKSVLGPVAAAVAVAALALPAASSATVVGAHVVTPQSVTPHVVTPAPTPAPAAAAPAPATSVPSSPAAATSSPSWVPASPSPSSSPQRFTADKPYAANKSQVRPYSGPGSDEIHLTPKPELPVDDEACEKPCKQDWDAWATGQLMSVDRHDPTASARIAEWKATITLIRNELQTEKVVKTIRELSEILHPFAPAPTPPTGNQGPPAAGPASPPSSTVGQAPTSPAPAAPADQQPTSDSPFGAFISGVTAAFDKPKGNYQSANQATEDNNGGTNREL